MTGVPIHTVCSEYIVEIQGVPGGDIGSAMCPLKKIDCHTAQIRNGARGQINPATTLDQNDGKATRSRSRRGSIDFTRRASPPRKPANDHHAAAMNMAAA